MVRRTYIAVVTASIAGASCADAPAAEDGAVQRATTPPSLEVVVGNGEFAFGSGRDRAVHILQLAISPGLPPGQRVFPRPGDLVGGGRVFPASQITVQRRLSTNRRMLKLVVALDPEGVKPGKYEGQLPLFVGGGLNRQIPLTATLRSHVHAPWLTGTLAFMAILGGAIAGAILKWLSEKGMRLQALRREYEAALLHLWNVRRPSGLSRRLAAIENSLDALDDKDAETGLAKITPLLDAFADLGSFFERHLQEISEQRERLPSQSSGMNAAGLRLVWEFERRRIEDLLDSSWPDPTATKDARTSFSQFVAVVSSFIEAFDRIRDHAETWRAITDLRSENTQKAVELLNSVGAPTTAVVPTAEASQPEAALPEPQRPDVSADQGAREPAEGLRRRWYDIRRWSIDNAGLVYGSMLALSVALVGLSLLYLPDETFGAATDWLTLVLWGFGVQLTGFTLVQLGGRALGSGPRLST